MLGREQGTGYTYLMVYCIGGFGGFSRKGAGMRTCLGKDQVSIGVSILAWGKMGREKMI